MTEQQPDQPTLDPQPDKSPEPEQEQEQAPEPAGEPVGFAVYDKTLLRFVGGVHSTKAKAEKATSKVKDHKYETRRV